MNRLIWVFGGHTGLIAGGHTGLIAGGHTGLIAGGHTGLIAGFVVRWLIIRRLLLVLLYVLADTVLLNSNVWKYTFKYSSADQEGFTRIPRYFDSNVQFGYHV